MAASAAAALERPVVQALQRMRLSRVCLFAELWKVWQMTVLTGTFSSGQLSFLVAWQSEPSPLGCREHTVSLLLGDACMVFAAVGSDVIVLCCCFDSDMELNMCVWL